MTSTFSAPALVLALALLAPSVAPAQTAAPSLPTTPPPPAPATPLPSYQVRGTNVVLAPKAPPASNPGTSTVISPAMLTPPPAPNQPPAPSVPGVVISIPLN